MYATVTVPSPIVTGAPDANPMSESRVLRDGREVVRVIARCPADRCGGTLTVFTDPGGLPLISRPCVLCWFRAEAARIRRGGLFTPSPRAAFAAEIERFRESFPEIARRLAHFLTAPEPAAGGRLFEAGSTLVERPLAEVAGALLTRHCKGDWGEYNGDPGPLSDDEAWGPALFSQAIVNRAAIMADGVVLSRFHHRLGSPQWIDVATLLSPDGEAETVIRFSDTHHEIAIDAAG